MAAGPSGIGCAVELRDRPELLRVVVRIDTGFKTTGIEPSPRYLNIYLGHSATCGGPIYYSVDRAVPKIDPAGLRR